MLKWYFNWSMSAINMISLPSEIYMKWNLCEKKTKIEIWGLAKKFCLKYMQIGFSRCLVLVTELWVKTLTSFKSLNVDDLSAVVNCENWEYHDEINP